MYRLVQVVQSKPASGSSDRREIYSTFGLCTSLYGASNKIISSLLLCPKPNPSRASPLVVSMELHSSTSQRTFSSVRRFGTLACPDFAWLPTDRHHRRQISRRIAHNFLSEIITIPTFRYFNNVDRRLQRYVPRHIDLSLDSSNSSPL